MSDELLPCPFCGAGETQIRENGKIWAGMKWSEPASVSVFHWCFAVQGQPSRAIERVGRDHASAVAAWNRRAYVLKDAFDPRQYELIAAAEEVMAACNAVGSFSNGVTDPTGTYDEGEQLASRSLERLRAALNPISAGGTS